MPEQKIPMALSGKTGGLMVGNMIRAVEEKMAAGERLDLTSSGNAPEAMPQQKVDNPEYGRSTLK